jgi:hypothetical protein
MVTLLSLEVKSFDPLDAVELRSDYEVERAPLEERQAYGKARERDSGLAQAFYEAMWGALRPYFGETYLPPLAVIEAYREGNEQPYGAWDRWVYTEVDPDQVTSLCYDEDFERLFIEVDHGDHMDLLILRIDGLELFFRPRVGSHTDGRERFFQPLLAEFAQRGLSWANQHLLVAFVDEGGLRAIQLPALLDQIGLQ